MELSRSRLPKMEKELNKIMPGITVYRAESVFGPTLWAVWRGKDVLIGEFSVNTSLHVVKKKLYDWLLIRDKKKDPGKIETDKDAAKRAIGGLMDAYPHELEKRRDEIKKKRVFFY